jgi:chromosome segregation ATPase
VKPKFWLALALAALLLLTGAGVTIWQARRNAAQALRLAQAEAGNQRLRAQVAELEKQLAAARAARQPAVEGRPEAEEKDSLESASAKVAADAAKIIQKLQESQAQATASISQLDSRVLDLQAQVGRLNAENQRLTASEADLKDSLAASKNLVDALQKELKTKSDRLIQTEVADQRLRQQTSADSQHLSQMRQSISELQDIYVRQDATLRRILRRYRDVTEQYRSIAGMLDNRRNDPGAVTNIDLSRIQNSITLAEEDLRQFDGLNAQVQRIQRKLSGK